MSPRSTPTLTGFAPRRNRTGLPRATAGKDSTSVGPFFLRNVSFNRAISASLTKQTVTPAPWNPTASCARRKDDSRGRRARRTARWRFRIIRAAFLYLVLFRILLRKFPLCRFQHFRRAADDYHHTLHRRELSVAPGCAAPRPSRQTAPRRSLRSCRKLPALQSTRIFFLAAGRFASRHR